MKYFYTHKEYRECQNEEPIKHVQSNGHAYHRNGLINGESKVFAKSKEAFIGKNYYFLLYSVFTFTSTNFLIYVVTWIPYVTLYLGLSFVGQMLLSLYGGGHDYVMLHFKRKETKEAFSKMNTMRVGKLNG